MRFRWVTLLAVFYIALDFATPLMPGAVHVYDGSLELDAGLYRAVTRSPAPAVTPLPRLLSTIVPPRELTFATGRVKHVSPPAPIFSRAPFEPSSPPTSSSDDD